MSRKVDYPVGFAWALTCDRCGDVESGDHTTEVDWPDGWTRVASDSPGLTVSMSAHADLCPACSAAHGRFLAGEVASDG